MYRTDTLLHTAALSATPACIARPTRFHPQARAAHGALRLGRRDSAMPARFQIV